MSRGVVLAALWTLTACGSGKPASPGGDTAFGGPGPGTSTTSTGTDTTPTGGANTGALEFSGARPKNLLVISLDTARRDYIGRYRGTGTTDFLDGVLAEGVALDDHRSCSNWTLTSTTCAQTGVFPVAQGFWPGTNDGVTPDTPADIPTLATILDGAGFATGLVSSNAFLGSGFPGGHGFADEVQIPEGDATAITDAGLELAASLRGDAPWYLHLHYYDPHSDYDPPASYTAALSGLPPLAIDLSTHDGVLTAIAAWHQMSPSDQELVLQYLDVLYSGELRYWDDELARLWAALDADGMLDDTLVVFWTDHGEQFMERGVIGHGVALYAEENRAAAGFWARGLTPGAYAAPTDHTDLVPTALAALGVSTSTSFDGRVVGTGPADREIRTFNYMGSDTPMLMLTSGRYQVNLTWDSGYLTFHDLVDDPLNLATGFVPPEPALGALRGSLDAYVADVEASLPSLGPAPSY